MQFKRLVFEKIIEEVIYLVGMQHFVDIPCLARSST